MNGDAAASLPWEPWVIAAPQTAPGVGVTVPISGAEVFRVLAVSFTLVTDANAANRLATLELRDDLGAPLASIPAPFTLAASLTSRYTFAAGLVAFGANDAARIGTALPPLVLEVGNTIVIGVASVQAGDQISNVRVAGEQQHTRP